jgi:hypothetical protein
MTRSAAVENCTSRIINVVVVVIWDFIVVVVVVVVGGGVVVVAVVVNCSIPGMYENWSLL